MAIVTPGGDAAGIERAHHGQRVDLAAGSAKRAGRPTIWDRLTGVSIPPAVTGFTPGAAGQQPSAGGQSWPPAPLETFSRSCRAPYPGAPTFTDPGAEAGGHCRTRPDRRRRQLG